MSFFASLLSAEATKREEHGEATGCIFMTRLDVATSTKVQPAGERQAHGFMRRAVSRRFWSMKAQAVRKCQPIHRRRPYEAINVGTP
jgi:hypothetical protein